MINVLAQSNGIYYSGSNAVSIVFLLIGVAVLGAGIWAAIDANKYEDWVWQQAGQNKVLWMVLVIGVPLLTCWCCFTFILGAIAVGIYFLVIKKKLDAAQSGGNQGGYGGGYGGGGGYPPAGPGGYPQPGGQAYPQPGQPQPGYPPPAQPQAYPPPQPGPTYPPQGGYQPPPG